MLNRREILAASGSLLTARGLAGRAIAQTATETETETVEVDLRRDLGPLAHIWSRCIGSDRAEITLRESWRKDAKRGREELGLELVRFHGIFDDELGVGPKRNLSKQGGEFNFQNVDAVYDGLLDLG